MRNTQQHHESRTRGPGGVTGRDRTSRRHRDGGRSRRRGSVRARGFTLLEALIASVVLATIVLAVGASLSSARQHSLEAEKLILATICADDLLSELASLPYNDLSSQSDIEQSEGALTTLDGVAYPSAFWQIGRSARVRPDVVVDAGLDVAVAGVRITVTAYDEHRVLAQVETFIPEPAS